MLTHENVAAVARVMAIFAPTPEVRLDLDGSEVGVRAIVIDHGLFYISETTFTVPSILGDQGVPGFLLEKTVTGPGNGYDILYDVDVSEVGRARYLAAILTLLAREYAAARAANILDDLAAENAHQVYLADKSNPPGVTRGA